MLKNKVAVYVPSTNYNKKITAQELRKRTEGIAKLLCEQYGGATVEAVKGYYKADSGELIAELINKIIAFHDGGNIDNISNHLKQKKNDWQQESIALEVDGVLSFI